jgi:hypothetical protein
MKIFEYYYMCADTCGNTWQDEKEPVRHLLADDLRKVWEHFKQPRVTGYTCKDGKSVMHIRTPKGQGYGIWEDNPDFNFENELNADNLSGFEAGAFHSLVVSELKPETI